MTVARRPRYPPGGRSDDLADGVDLPPLQAAAGRARSSATAALSLPGMRRAGPSEAVADGDAERLHGKERFRVNCARFSREQKRARRGYPQDFGFCPEHASTLPGDHRGEHRCNLDARSASQSPAPGHRNMGFSLSLEQVESMLDAFVRAEGEPEAVSSPAGSRRLIRRSSRCSGGARSRHPAGDAQHQRDAPGARPALRRALAEIGVHVYLQFDGLQQATQLAIRGKCCVSEIVPDGRLIPFCAYNSVGYREQMRLALSGGTGRGAMSIQGISLGHETRPPAP